MRKTYCLFLLALALVFTAVTKTQAQVIVSAGATIVAESCAPANGVIDPNETVTLSFCVQNTGGSNTVNMVGTLQATGGVVSPSGPQNYGVVIVGGAPVCRNFTFTANGSCGGTLTASIQFQDGASNLGTINYVFTLGLQNVLISQNFDALVIPALPAGWTTSFVNGDADCTVGGPLCAQGSNWTTTATGASVPNAAFHNDPSCVTDGILQTPTFAVATAGARVSFSNNFNTENTFDGMVLEVSSPNINGGAFTDITSALVGGSFVSGGYNGTISGTFLSPIAGRQAWTGNSAGFISTVANLGPNVAGQTISLRWRMASDCSVSSTGVTIDNIVVFDGYNCCASACVAPAITTQPVNRTICQNGNTTFAVANIGTSPTYQWQISTAGAGGPWTSLANVAPFSNVTTATLTVTGAGTVYNGNFFRVVITTACGTVNSTAVSLTVNPLPTVNSGPSGLCAPVTITASGNANTYAWTPTTGLNVSTGPTVIASPTTTTVYTVTGTITATGCQNSASVTVLGTPATPVITPPAPVICAGTIQSLSVPPTLVTISGGAATTIPALGTATPYPATLNVSGLPATGVIVKSVTINGVTHTFPDDIDMLLQSPTGTNVVLMSDVGGLNSLSNVTYTFDDAGPLMIDGGPNPAGTYRPTNFVTPDTWVAPGPGAITQATPTLASFTGNFNGVWNLYIVDDLGGDQGSTGTWSITFQVNTAIWTPITGLFSDPNAQNAYVAGTPLNTVYFLQSPLVTTQYTYTVINTLGTCSSAPATVTVTVNPKPTLTVTPASGCGPLTLTAAGNYNTVTWTPITGLFTDPPRSVAYTAGGNSSIVYAANPPLDVTYTATATLTGTGCTATATATVNAVPPTPVIVPANVQVCVGTGTRLAITPTTLTTPIAGPIAIPEGAPTVSVGNASPYPSTITVNGLPVGGVRVKSVNINGISHTFPSDIDMLLVAPNGQNVVVMSDAGGGNDLINFNLVFDDAAANYLPAVITSGTWKPTNSTGNDNFPAPGPGIVNGTNQLLSSFTGNLNGAWRLFIVDQAAGDPGSITSWSITFETGGGIWTPVTGLFLDPLFLTPYVAGTYANAVYAKPATTTTYSVSRATATCASGVGTSVVNVIQPVTITTQPASQTACQGANVTFSVVTGGNFQSYQWQISTGGGPFTNIAGANNSTLVLTNVQPALSGNQYRVVIVNTCSTITSAAATLTVNPLPVVTIGALPARICISDSAISLLPLGNPVGGSWTGIGVSGFNFFPAATAVGTYTLTYTYSTGLGCTANATVIAKVEDCPERIRLLRDDAVILYPNPNNGNFNIRMNSTLYNYLNMKVFSSSGRLVADRNFNGLIYGRVINIDITNLPADVYMIRFYYRDGVRTSEKTFKVIVGAHQ